MHWLLETDTGDLLLRLGAAIAIPNL